MHKRHFSILSPVRESLTASHILLFVAALIAMVWFADTICQGQPQPLMTRHVREVTANGKARLVGRLPKTQVMRLVLVLPPSHQTELKSFLQELYDPSSPSYRKFLTVEEFTARFGPAQEDYDAVVHFAETHGLTVAGTSRNRMNLDVTGPVASIENALHVTIGDYQHPSEKRTFFAPDREPTLDLPFELWHIAGLDNYSIPRSLLRTRSVADGGSGATIGSGPSASFIGSDMRAAYYGSGPLTGSGQSLGILEYLGTDLEDLNTYFGNVGQTNNVPITLLSTDGTPTSCLDSEGCDDTEQTLDMTQALGMAPGLSSVVMYVGSSDSAILNAMATASPLNFQLSSSWMWMPADPDTDDPYFLEFAAQGQTFFQAAGDWSAWAPGSFNYPAEDAYVTSVGGTSVQTAGPNGAWSSETAWGYSGGGISPEDIVIPPWQMATATNCSSCSTTYRNGPDVAANADFTFYVCADQTACSANLYGGTSFAAPMWAAYLALANQQAAADGIPPLGFINPTLYAIGLEPNYDTDFHDITSGNNGFPATVGYDLTTGWGSPNGPNLINDLIRNASGPGFILSASSGPVTIWPGGSGISTITSTATNGFNSVITFSATGLPAGVGVSFNPTSMTGNGASVMTITVGPSTTAGTFVLTVAGTSGSTTQTVNVLLTVPGVLRSIAVTPASATIQFPGSLQFIATGNYSDGSSQYLTGTATWSSSNPAVATISASGVATAVALGSTSITASFNNIKSNAATLAVQVPAATPALSPSTGTYYTPQFVTLSDKTPGVTFYYTTNGSMPTTSSTPYTGPIPVSTNTTIEAIAAGNGYGPSSVVAGIYTIQALGPTISPGTGTFNTPLTVTISDATPGTTIYYTTNGSIPTTSSTPYAGPIPVSTTTTIEAIAAGNGYGPSSVTAGIYTMQALAPTISPGTGTYNTPQTVTISDATPGTTIYYTTNGSIPTTSSTPYTGPISVSTTTTIEAIAASNVYGPSPVIAGIYTIQALAPTLSPASGSFSTSQTVTISDGTPGVAIYYTTNGSTPTTSSIPYTGPITVSTTTTIKAIAAGGIYGPGPVAIGNYTFQALTPTLSPGTGTYATPQTVSISDATPGVAIYYTTDGSTPMTSSILYTGPIMVSATATIKAMAASGVYSPSPLAAATYTFSLPAPTFSPAPGTYYTPTSVTLSDATPGVTIYYTTNGYAPTTSSTPYTGPITVSTSTTIRAIAAGSGYGTSSSAAANYTIQAYAPTFSPVPGTYYTPTSVTLSDASPGVTIYYTTNGYAPTTSSTPYTGPIPVSTTTSIRAIAAGNGYATSSSVAAAYTIQAYAPTFSPAPGTYHASVSVTLSDVSPGVTIYYTTNGSVPSTSSTPYTGPITVSATTVIRAIAAGNGYGSSTSVAVAYTIN